jgi:hypothetical protein
MMRPSKSPQTYSRRLPSNTVPAGDRRGQARRLGKLIELFRHVLEQDSAGGNSEEREV